jgi:cell wall-associated NlpC family hydrolase
MQPGDFILCHRKGIVSSIIRLGERIRFRSGDRWSHVAIVENDEWIIEALTKGVVRSHISVYDKTEKLLVSSGLDEHDRPQAVAFAQSCVGQKYGWLIIFGIALRFLTPGRGLWFGSDGSEICSGLVAQALVRGPKIFKVNPASITPAELAEEYAVPHKSK